MNQVEQIAKGWLLAWAEAGESGLAKAGVDDPNKVDACECWQAMFDAAIRGLGE